MLENSISARFNLDLASHADPTQTKIFSLMHSLSDNDYIQPHTI